MSNDKIKVTIIKDGLQVGTQPIAVGAVLEVDSDRKAWLEQRAFIAPSDEAAQVAAATTAATTTTPSKSKATGLPSPSTAEEAK
ncbi:hypothetical protein [Xanthomonas citri]|uniref:hypothetical protein n=1 Tax=Xanthomonas citri TaxID=346 RepID=UPI0002F89191|nr:hypothetical protein [Xanthomonas citri]AMV00330.1 hypothetical protein TP37_21235 [Xanthomonas citri pv. aurantifolii]AMV04646.1 hypothetical protein TP50_21030 [Xanthomonas citri pv. aurantifolii]MCC8491382.1 hypothetical protein [Xanthomonas citri pv. fuscans]TBW97646.1 hypothetical protein TP47_10870 [Xanthomonas citri pv. aurantifolii]TBW99052.1 hypothetical protein TP49_05735 [Xanthomonas citri pv. aurantifolii]